jgi:hypothetical protein
MLGVPLMTSPGDYTVEISLTNESGEERTAVVQVTVEPFATPAAITAAIPVVLLDGFQLGSCPIPVALSNTFGNLQTYLSGAPNNISPIYFFGSSEEIVGGLPTVLIGAKEIAQPEVLVGTKVLTATEQQPAGFPEDQGAALTSHTTGFLGTDVVQSLGHIDDDVKAVEDMQRLGAVFAHQLQIGFQRGSERKQGWSTPEPRSR